MRLRGASGNVRTGADGRVFVDTISGERQYLETAAPTAAVHGNPGFEDETAGVPDLWDFTWYAGTPTVASETTVRYSGDRSLRVDLAAASDHLVVLSDTFDVPSGGSVDFSTFAMSTLGSPHVRLGLLTRTSGTPLFLDEPNSFNNEPAAADALAVPTDWAMFRRKASVPAGHTRGRIFYRVSPAAGEAVRVYLDLTASGVSPAADYASGWFEPTYATGWAAWTDTTKELPRIQRRGDRVTLTGNLYRSSGAGTLMFTLDEGLRPSREVSRGGQVVNGATLGIVTVAADGSVSLTSAYTTGQSVSLNVEFGVDQP